MKTFEGKVAVVTGAASGIGRALALRFGREGMKVVLADVESGALAQAKAELTQAGVESIAVKTDVMQADALHSLAEQTLDEFGAAHILCNNAGVFAGGLSWEAPLSDYEWVLGVNVWGVLHGIRAFVPIMLEQDTECHIVNTASMAAVTTSPLAAAYYMSKHAVLSLSETLYHELSQRGSKIGVSALCPELISTGIGKAQRNRPEHLQRKDGEGDTPETAAVEGAINAMIDAQGAPPERMAERVVEGIRDNRFYILSEPGDGWRTACNTRLEDIRSARNPSLVVPEVPPG
jgi:NAD(P)-dependent dehydrogenase (short-subunit alcohol dehydrogenase family)